MGADVFISYSRDDRETAHRLADALTAEGLSTWWDRDLLIGSNFADAILEQLRAARVVCVLWSPSALESTFVYDEAMRAHREGKLLPVRIAEVDPPLGFGALQTQDLTDWDGDAEADKVQELITQLRLRIARPAEPRPRPRPWAGWWPEGSRRRWLIGAAAAAAVGAVGWHRVDRYMADDYVLAGLEANRNNDLQAARRHFQLALDYAPRHAVAHYELANVYLRLYLEGGSQDSRLQVDAQTHFGRAVQYADGLDTQQLGDATRFAASIAAPDVGPAVTRTAQVERPASAPVAVAPERLAASGDVERSADLQGQALFDASTDRRVAALNVLAVNPALAADSVQPAMEQAIAAIQRDGASPATRDGVGRTLTLLKSASPGTLRANRRDVQRLIDSARTLGGPLAESARQISGQLARAETLPPLVYLQIARGDQRGLADRIIDRMAEAGYATAGVETVGPERAPERTSLRVQGASDGGYARWCAAMIETLTGQPVDVITLRQARPRTDTYEIWLGRGLCEGTEQRGCA